LKKQQTDLWGESWNIVGSLESDEATQHNLLAIVARNRVLIDAILMEMTESLGLNPDHLTTTQGEQNGLRFFTEREFSEHERTAWIMKRCFCSVQIFCDLKCHILIVPNLGYT
jgi:hypothetical protein